MENDLQLRGSYQSPPLCTLHVYAVAYGVASISRLLKITGLFCRIQSLSQGSFAKETYHFKEPTLHVYVYMYISISIFGALCALYMHHFITIENLSIPGVGKRKWCVHCACVMHSPQ